MHPTVVFDLDGVLFHTNHDAVNFSDADWHRWWTEPENHVPVTSTIKLLHALRRAGIYLIILTGRPREYEIPTILALAAAGVHRVRGVSDPAPPTVSPYVPVHLVMLDADTVPSDTSSWKAKKIQEWTEDRRLDIWFVLEDYKVNADAIRKHVPVLLYERQK